VVYPLVVDNREELLVTYTFPEKLDNMLREHQVGKNELNCLYIKHHQHFCTAEPREWHRHSVGQFNQLIRSQCTA